MRRPILRIPALPAMACAASLALAAPVALAPAPAAATQLLPENLSDLVATLLPSVVNISTLKENKVPVDPKKPIAVSALQPKKSLGSGFFIDEDGTIATAGHVTDGAEEITVTLYDGSEYPAHVLYRAPLDMALLKIDARPKVQPITWGDSERMRPGDPVIAIGNPLGLGSTVTAGIVSALDRDIQETKFDSFLQTDAAINPGNSGGPLFNASGEVIGITNSIFTRTDDSGSIGLAFALLGNDAQFVVNNFREFGRVREGWLGVTVQSVTPGVADAVGMSRAMGVLVTSVVPDSPADKAKLREGDVIASVGGKPIDSVRHFNRIVGGTPFDETTTVTYFRDGKIVSVDAAFAESPNTQVTAEATMPPPPPRVDQPSLGVHLGPITKEARVKYKIPANQQGLLVTKVDANSIAWNMGARPGHVIVQVQQTPITSQQDMDRALQQARQEGKHHVMCKVLDQGVLRWVNPPLLFDDD
jgi:serine protease Do